MKRSQGIAAAKAAEKRPVPQIKTLTLQPAHRADMKKLNQHLSEGWEIVSETKRGALQWSPGQVDYVLRKVS